MSTLDYICIGILVLFTLLGAYWGAIRQVLSIVGLVAGVVIAGRNYERFANWLSGLVSTEAPAILNIIAFVLIMFAVSAVASIIATIIRKFARLFFMGGVDRLLGAVLGFVQGALLIAVLLAVLTAYPTGGISDSIQASKVAEYWRLPVKWSLNLLPEKFRTLNELVFDL